MQRQLRGDLAGKGRHAEVLHDEGVRPGPGRAAHGLAQGGQLVRVNAASLGNSLL